MPSRLRSVLCFGDSNTHGSLPMRDMDDRRRLAPDERWPGVLAGALGNDWRVIEEGLPGRTTVHEDPIEGAHKNGLAALPVALESHAPLDLVILMLGTNDLKARFSVTGEDIAASVERLVLAVHASQCGDGHGAPDVLLVAPPAILETGCLAGMFAGGAEKSRTLGALYEAVAGRHSVAFLDAGQAVRSSPIDGIHLEADAHANLADAVTGVVGSFGW